MEIEDTSYIPKAILSSKCDELDLDLLSCRNWVYEELGEVIASLNQYLRKRKDIAYAMEEFSQLYSVTSLYWFMKTSGSDVHLKLRGNDHYDFVNLDFFKLASDFMVVFDKADISRVESILDQMMFYLCHMYFAKMDVATKHFRVEIMARSLRRMAKTTVTCVEHVYLATRCVGCGIPKVDATNDSD
jgi:hypothetical protein